MHRVKPITVDNSPPEDPNEYNAQVRKGGRFTFRIKMPWVKEDAVLIHAFHQYVEDCEDLETPFETLFDAHCPDGYYWFDIIDNPPHRFEDGIGVQDITIEPHDDLKPGPYQVHISRIIHSKQAGAGDIMYTIRRRHTYAIVVVGVKGRAECTCRR